MKLAALDEEMAQVVVEPARVAVAREQLFSLGQAWQAASTDQRREWVRLVFKAVYANARQREMLFRPWEDFLPLFQERREWVCSLGPAGSKPWQQHIQPLLFSPRELVAA